MNIQNNKAFVLHHLGLGDMLTMNGAVRYLATFYDEVYVVCKEKYIKNIKKIYGDDLKIKIIMINDNDFLYYNKKRDTAIKNLQHNGFDIYLSGAYKDDNRDELFFVAFYKHMGFDYNIKKQYQKLNRDLSIEKALFDKIITNNNIKEYIFLHNDSSNIKLNILDNTYINNDVFVFNVNSNFYINHKDHKFYHIWNNTYSDLLDYCMLIENANELHLIDSSFYTISLFLDLTKIKIKNVYPRDNSASSNFYNTYDHNTFKVIYK